MTFTPTLTLKPSHCLTLNPQMRQAIDLLKFTNAQLRDHLQRCAGENPFLRVPYSAQQFSGSGIPDDCWVAAAPSLYEHVSRQVGLAISDPAQLAIGIVFLESLEPTGWLGASLAEIARAAGTSPANAKAVLKILQGFEPTGIFALNLQDCLRLQAIEAGIHSPDMASVIDRLPLMTTVGVQGVARACALPVETVNDCLAQIRRFDPKPGLKLSSDNSPLREPDILVTRAGKNWHVELNRTTLPGISVSAVDMKTQAGQPDFTNAKAAFSAAKWLAQAVQRRNATTLKVAASAVKWQGGYIEGDASALAPMRCIDLAKTTGLHESTVSRVANGLLLQTPKGVITMKTLFSRGIARTGNSAAAVKHRLRCIIRNENPNRPLSDMAIVKTLGSVGINVSRRTIAKYRSVLGIPVRQLRRDLPPYS